MGCVLLISSPDGPKQYGASRVEGCTITVTCMDRNDFRNIITVTCPGQKQCRDWTENWKDQYRCEENDGGCVKITYPVTFWTKTGTECGPCEGYTGGDCGCPDGFSKY